MENLVPILGLDSINDIHPESALVRDLGAESIDYVEILYMIENEFGVKIKISEITMNDYGAEGFPEDGRLTAELAAKLKSIIAVIVKRAVIFYQLRKLLCFIQGRPFHGRHLPALHGPQPRPGHREKDGRIKPCASIRSTR